MSPATVLTVPGMERHLASPDLLRCLLLILRKNDSEVLVLEGDGSNRLPTAEVSRTQRITPHLLNAVRTRFGLNAICRFSVTCDRSQPECCSVLEAMEGDSLPNRKVVWLPVGEIIWDRIEPVAARELLWLALARVTSYNAGHLDGRFVRPGSFGEITTWVGQSLESRGLRLQGPWTQLTMGPDFSLFRFGTNGPRVWFKATDGPNLREFDITSRLAQLQLPHLPEVIAAREDWHAWLMFDGDGQPLDSQADETRWKAVARSLGELQLASIPYVDELANSGCDDFRLACLRPRIEPFLSDLATLMEAQTTIPPARLGRADLQRIGICLKAACAAADSVGLPDALGHSDISSGNVLAGRQGAVFLDWMQAHIGFPFLTFEYLLALARRIAANRPIAFDAVRREYLECWRLFRPVRQLEQTFDFVPLIAAFAYALTLCGSGSPRNPRPELAPLIRSLGRRMHVVAERLERANRLPKRI